MKKSYVYLICDSLKELYKIGVTRGKVENRIKELQTGNGSELHIVNKFSTKYPFFIEKQLHLKYRKSNVLNEWFELSNEDINNFIKYCNEIEDFIQKMSSNEFFCKLLK